MISLCTFIFVNKVSFGIHVKKKLKLTQSAEDTKSAERALMFRIRKFPGSNFGLEAREQSPSVI
jgi:hypothetical protein